MSEREKVRASKDAPYLKQEDRRQQLLAAAIAVFSEKSFDGATVKDIADRAEMNVAMVSYYFEGKVGLYLACLESLARERFVILEEILKTPLSISDFQAKVRLFVESCIQDQIDQPQIIQLIHNEIHQGLPYARAIFKDTFLRVFNVLVEFFDQAKKSKLLRSDCDTRLCAMFIHGALMHMVGNDRLREEFFDISMKDLKMRKKIIDQFTAVILGGLVTPNSLIQLKGHK
jgi:AcrR family transcriptional regulator